jgi:hypothetical protein
MALGLLLSLYRSYYLCCTKARTAAVRYTAGDALLNKSTLSNYFALFIFSRLSKTLTMKESFSCYLYYSLIYYYILIY